MVNKLQHRHIENTDELFQSTWITQGPTDFKKFEIPEDFEEYFAEYDPEDKPVRQDNSIAKKGTLNLPVSSAFGCMMRAEMSAATLQGPRKLKKDDYKEYLIETAEEKKALTVKPAPKPRAAPKNSWRSSGGFKIPSKEEQEKQQKDQEEEKELIPAPQEYKIPQQNQNKQQKPNQNQNQGKNHHQNQNRNKNRNRGKRAGKNPNQQTPHQPGGQPGTQPGSQPDSQQQYDQNYDQNYYGNQDYGY